MKFSTVITLSAVSGFCYAQTFNIPIPWLVSNISIYRTGSEGGNLTFQVADLSGLPGGGLAQQKFDTICTLNLSPTNRSTPIQNRIPCQDSTVTFGFNPLEYLLEGKFEVLIEHSYTAEQCKRPKLKRGKGPTYCVDKGVLRISPDEFDYILIDEDEDAPFYYSWGEDDDDEDEKDDKVGSTLVAQKAELAVYPYRDIPSTTKFDLLSLA